MHFLPNWKNAHLKIDCMKYALANNVHAHLFPAMLKLKECGPTFAPKKFEKNLYMKFSNVFYIKIET